MNLIISSDPFAQITFNALAACPRPVGRTYLSRLAPKMFKNNTGNVLYQVCLFKLLGMWWRYQISDHSEQFSGIEHCVFPNNDVRDMSQVGRRLLDAWMMRAFWTCNPAWWATTRPLKAKVADGFGAYVQPPSEILIRFQKDLGSLHPRNSSVESLA